MFGKNQPAGGLWMQISKFEKLETRGGRYYNIEAVVPMSPRRVGSAMRRAQLLPVVGVFPSVL